MPKRLPILLLCVLICIVAVSCDLRFDDDQSISVELDPTFGEAGQVQMTFPEYGEYNMLNWTIAIQPDGKIVTGGWVQYREDSSVNDAKSLEANIFAGVSRYNKDGSLDETFGKGGKVVTHLNGGDSCMVRHISIDLDGNIVVAVALANRISSSETGNTPQPIYIALIRYHPNGDPDETFGENGVVMIHLVGDHFGDSGNIYGMDADRAGNIILLYSTDRMQEFPIMHMLRYSRNGDMDTTFGENGKVVTGLADWHQWNRVVNRPIAIDNAGKILIVGRCDTGPGIYSDTALERYNPDGSPDLTFGENGRAASGTLQPYRGQNIKLLDGGTFLVLGSTLISMGAIEDVYVARYNYDGSVDQIFDHREKLTIVGDRVDFRNKIATHAFYRPDGTIIVTGFTGGNILFGGGYLDLFLACYNQNGVLNTNLGDEGIMEMTFFDGENLSDMAIQADGNILATGLVRADSDPETDYMVSAFARFVVK